MLLSEVLNKFHVLPRGQRTLAEHTISALTLLIDISWNATDTGRLCEQEFYDQEIRFGALARAHPGEFYVTNIHGEACAFLALGGAVLKPERLVVVLEGGLVQGVLSETTAMELVVIDYDTEGASEDEICTIPQYGGGTAQATAISQTTEVYPETVRGVFSAVLG